MNSRQAATTGLFASLLALTTAFAQAQRPVVIIGGWGNEPADYDGTRLVNALLRPRLADAPSNVFLSKHEDPHQDINANAAFEARAIRAYLDRLKQAGAMPGDDFDIIGHSMGGLIARVIALKHQPALGSYRIANLVTVGTPNQGASFTLTTLNKVNPRAKIAGESTVASSQMNPKSEFLRDLNSRSIPASIKVITIAGDVRLMTPPTPLHREDSRSVPCVHLISQHASDSVSTPCTHFKSCSHSKTLAGKTLQLHPNDGPEHSSDSKSVPCVHKVKQHGSDQASTPCTHLRTGQRGTNSDGFIYVSSVRLQPGQAANIGAQNVYPDVYHTTTTRESWMKAPEKINLPFPGKPIDGTWLFDDQRIVSDLTALLSRSTGPRFKIPGLKNPAHGKP